MPDIRKQFGGNVKKWRLQRGISQEKLAERASLHRTYITDIERGARNLSLGSMERLALALDVSLRTLFTDVGDAPAGTASTRASGGLPELLEILLVEDNPRDVEWTLRAFRKGGLRNRVHVVHDGAAALEFLLPTSSNATRRPGPLPHVVLLDLGLPKVDGLEVLRRVKADPRTHDVAVVVLTVSERDFDLQECQRFGADGYLVKPVDFHQFTRVTPQLAFQWALLGGAERAAL